MSNRCQERKLKWNKANYRELSCFKLTKSCTKRSPRKVADKLFPVDVIEQQDGHVKIHYIGILMSGGIKQSWKP